MKRAVMLLAVAGLIGAGGLWSLRSRSAASKAVALQAPVSVGDITQAVPAIGTLTALRTVRVGSQVSGTVTKLYADYNSVVKKDQIIAELDPSLLEIQVSINELNLARQEIDLASQRNQLEDEQKNLARAQRQFDRGVVSRQQLEAAELKVRTRIGTIASAEKQKVQTLAQLNQARLRVSYCTIRSPIDGVVVSRLVDVGQVVQASANTPNFFTIAADLTTMRIIAGVDEADIGRIRPHLPATFTVGAYPGETFTGEIEAVRLNAQNLNYVVTYPVWITASNSDLRLRPNMTATMKIIIGTASNVVRVPNQALKFRATASMYGWFGLPAPQVPPGRRLVAEPGQGRTGAAAPTANEVMGRVTPITERDADRIDDLFPSIVKPARQSEVWVYDETEQDEGRRLRSIPVRTGFSDEQFSELVSGDVEPGMQVVMGVLPPSNAQPETGGSLFIQPQRSRGGMTPVESQGPTRLAPPRGGGGRGGGE